MIIRKNRTFRMHCSSRGEVKDREYLYLSCPYINDDAINRKIVKCFQREGLPVRLYHTTYSLRNASGPRNRVYKICNKRNVMYEIRCSKCEGAYVGSTIRNLHDRVYEHFHHNKNC